LPYERPIVSDQEMQTFIDQDLKQEEEIKVPFVESQSFLDLDFSIIASDPNVTGLEKLGHCDFTLKSLVVHPNNSPTILSFNLQKSKCEEAKLTTIEIHSRSGDYANNHR